MARHFPLTILCAAVFLFMPEVFAQDDEPAPPSSTEEVQDEKEANPGSQEVEYSEDNYRRFMELKDQNLQKSSLPTNKYQSGTQKLDELPESSQKHLRNQLREIISQGDAWTPGDEDKQYPYVPSEAAEGNASLKQKEAEAWQELVGEYHEREAQIHANAARSDAAGAAAKEGDLAGGSAARAGSGGGDGNDGGNAGSQGTGKQGKQTGQEQQGTQDRNQGGYSPGAAVQQGNPNAGSTAGVSENALEFLMKNGGLESGKESGAAGAPSGGEAQSEMTAQTGQEITVGKTAAADTNANNPAASEAMQKENKSQSASGSSQSAMEYLKGNENQDRINAQDEMPAQTGQEITVGQKVATDSNAKKTATVEATQDEQQSQSAAGSSQNAMEYLTGSENQDSSDATTSASPMDPDYEFEVVSKGTLSIKDLSNVRGVASPTQNNSSSTLNDKSQKKKDKDDGPQ